MRRLPWRENPRDPYRTLVSEIMLQQTQVKTVISYYDRWIARFPSLQALASAEEDDVLKLWEGLGYYRRAGYLLRTAKIIMSELSGHFPGTMKDLQSLPGVGRYTAAAIASICFGENVLAVDGNIRRIASRQFMISGRVNTKDVENVMSPLVPESTPGAFNEALMELGATICSPVDPDCEICPVSFNCKAHSAGCPTDFPELQTRQKVQIERARILLLARNGKLLMKKRRQELLRGLYGFPVLSEESPVNGEILPEIRHSYSNKQLTVQPVWISEPVESYGQEEDGLFFSREEIDRLALSVLDRKILSALEDYQDRVCRFSKSGYNGREDPERRRP